MQNSRGFTIIEIALVMVTLGIMAALTLVKYQKTVAFNELQKTANNVYADMHALRSQALKWDALVITKFAAAKIENWIDTAGSNKVDAACIYSKISLPANIAIGLPASPPVNGPYGGTIPASGLRGKWVDSLITLPDSKSDTCYGELYLYSKKVSKITYCIGKSPSAQSVELYKWDGVWQKL